MVDVSSTQLISQCYPVLRKRAQAQQQPTRSNIQGEGLNAGLWQAAQAARHTRLQAEAHARALRTHTVRFGVPTIRPPMLWLQARGELHACAWRRSIHAPTLTSVSQRSHSRNGSRSPPPGRRLPRLYGVIYLMVCYECLPPRRVPTMAPPPPSSPPPFAAQHRRVCTCCERQRRWERQRRGEGSVARRASGG